ncbi:MAG: hypothetical protein ACI837_002248 [Crocinitomicaceae bacterium]|jgi:hypothetical protein
MLKPFIIILALFSITNVLAQKITVGPEIGLNLIQVENQNIGNDYQPAWYAGAALDYKIYDWFSVQSGIYFSQSRHSYTAQDTSVLDILDGIIDSSFVIPGIDLNTYTSTNGRQSHYYIQLPVTANFSWNNIQFSVGAYAGFMVGGKQQETSISRTPILENLDLSALDPSGLLTLFLPPAYSESYEETSGTEGFRVFDYGLKAGLGYQMDRVGVQASYSFGIPDFRIDSEEDVERNQFFQFSVRYMFPLGKK